MKVLIIEDELNAFDILSKRIRKLVPEVEILAHLKTIVESLTWFQQGNVPDLIFLDVELADGRSFEIFHHIDVQCPIIFTTAYDQYAIKAFRLNSVDYLLKPISEADLSGALEKFWKMKATFSPDIYEQLKQLLKKEKEPKRKRFLINSGEKYFFIKSRDIAFFYAEDGLTFLKTLENSRHLVSETLDSIENQLDRGQFFRINRHQIINIEAITQIHEYFNRRFKLALKAPYSEEEFIVSRLRRAEFKNWLQGGE